MGMCNGVRPRGAKAVPEKHSEVPRKGPQPWLIPGGICWLPRQH